MFDAATQSDLFNEFISPGVISEIRSRSKLFDQIRKDWEQIEPHGEFATQKLLTAASQSNRAASNSSYPEAAESDPAKTRVYVKRAQMFSLHFDGIALEAAERMGTPISPIEFEKKGIFISISDDMSRQLMGDGSGRIARANGAGVATATLTVDHPWYADATKFMKKKRVIDIYLGAVQEVNSVKISTQDSPTQVTLESNQNWTDDAWILNEDIYCPAVGLGLGEMMGLMGIIDDADPPVPHNAGLQGLDVATYPDWVAYVDTNGGVARPLVEDLFIQMLQETELYATTDVILVSQGVFRVWYSLLTSYKTLPNTKTMWGGWSGLPFFYDGREIPVVSERFVPDGNAMALSNENLIMHVLNPNLITWEKGDASNILQKVANKNEFVAEGHIFGNLGTGLRPGFGRIEDLQEP